MRYLTLIAILLALAGCSTNELSYVSIRNNTDVPIYALPYASDYSEGDWIPPGATDEFYSIACDCLDGYEYFSYYYDSLIVKFGEEQIDPVKFYKTGKTVNYDPTLNPFTNPSMWRSHEFEQSLETTSLESNEKTHIMEHYFPIDVDKIKSLSDTVRAELNPAS